MKFAKKEFLDYWKMIKAPVYVLVAWSVLGLIFGLVSFSLYASIFSPLAGWILIIAAFSFIGWSAVKDHHQPLNIAAWSGALAGAIYGFASAVISILMFYLVPEIIKAAISQAAQAGANAAAIESFMAIGIYIGLVTGPLISAVIGAIIASITAMIAKKV
ncbi:hypothetical protein KY366_03600 [Candidatus Woesearchaeota archaeon]|nr:hypothetical protein [Candidatus Woesearchaeota archaeon]